MRWPRARAVELEYQLDTGATAENQKVRYVHFVHVRTSLNV
jgi:hypothetical protein